MKFSCNREELDRQLQYVSRVVTPRSTLPVLSNLLLETDGDKVRISATDLELAIATHVTATIEQEGSFTVPAKLFQDFIHQNPDTEVSFSLQSHELHATSSQVNAQIPGIEAEEYPPLPTMQEKGAVSLAGQEFVAALKQVVIACAQDQGRPVLTGVLCHLSKEQVTLAATDSFRLVERQVPGLPVAEHATILIPQRTIQELIRVVSQMGEGEQEIQLSLSDQQIVIRLNNVEIYSRLLTGSFPKYQNIIPQSYVAEITVESHDITQALRLSTIFGQAGIANVVMEVTEDGALTLQSHGNHRGAAKHTLRGEVGVDCKPIKAAFNTRYLLDAIGATGADQVTLKFSGQTSPLVVSTGSEEYLQLVMPIRLDS